MEHTDLSAVVALDVCIDCQATAVDLGFQRENEPNGALDVDIHTLYLRSDANATIHAIRVHNK